MILSHVVCGTLLQQLQESHYRALQEILHERKDKLFVKAALMWVVLGTRSKLNPNQHSGQLKQACEDV